jgi:hypothetical protein
VTRRVIECATQEDAHALARSIATRANLPRCGCPACSAQNGGRYIPGRRTPPPCPCVYPAVDLSCRWVTARYATVRKHPTESRWYVGPIKDRIEPVLTTSERSAVIDEPTAVRDVADEPDRVREGESGTGDGGGGRVR